MQAALVLVPLILAGVVQFPIVRNYFFSDDFLNLYRIENDGVVQYLLTPLAGHVLVVRNALFLLFARAFDVNPAPYFWVVWLTHLGNVALLFFVIRHLTDSVRLACFGAALWGTSPLHNGTLGWYSVYGQVVAATALLVVLELVARAGAARRAPSPRLLRLCYALALVAVMSFGVGIGFALALPLVIAWVAPESRRAARWGVPLWSLFVVVPALYIALYWLSGLFCAEGLSLPRTLLTLAVQNAAVIPARLAQLPGYGVMLLSLSFALAPTYYSDGTAYAVVGVLVLCGMLVAWRATTEVRRALAASALLTLACYGTIVAGRVSVFNDYSTAIVVSQPRYHYAGLVPLTIVLCVLLSYIGSQLRLRPPFATAMLVLWLALLIAAYARSGFAVDNHDLAKRQTQAALDTIQSLIDAQVAGKDVYIDNRGFAPFPGGVPKPQFPGWAAAFVIFYPDNTVAGRRVHFVDPQVAVCIASTRGKRSRGLIVPFAEVD